MSVVSRQVGRVGVIGQIGRWVRRILLILLVVVVVLAVAGAIYQAVAEANDRRNHPPPGQLVDVGGYRLHLYCTGSGSPTVVLNAGGGGSWLDWSLVQPPISQQTRVCAFDRAGLGWSESGPAPRDTQQAVKELHTLLGKSGERSPYILVGHSLGGLQNRLYASQYPDEVAGLVLVDATTTYTPEQIVARMNDEQRRKYDDLLKQAGPDALKPPPGPPVWLIRAAGWLGILRLLGGDSVLTDSVGGYLAPANRASWLAVNLRANTFATTLEEVEHYEANMQQVRDNERSLGGKPVTLIMHGLPGTFAKTSQPNPDADFFEPVYRDLERETLGRLSTRGKFVVAERSAHYVQLDQPDLVTAEVLGVVEAARR